MKKIVLLLPLVMAIHVQVEQTDIMLPIVPTQFDSLVSVDVTKGYSVNGVHDSWIVYIFENPLNKCNIDRSGKFIDIGDLVYLVDYMFRDGEL